MLGSIGRRFLLFSLIAIGFVDTLYYHVVASKPASGLGWKNIAGQGMRCDVSGDPLYSFLYCLERAMAARVGESDARNAGKPAM